MHRKVGCFIVAIVVFGFAARARAQDEGACADLTCNGHGRCIIIRNEPACACDEGFVADATALNCVSTAPPTPVAPIEVTPTPVPSPEVTPVPAPTPTPAPQPAPARRDRMLTIRLSTTFLSERERPYLNCRIAGLSYEVAGLPLVLLAVINDLAGAPDVGAFLEYSVSDTMLGIGAALVVAGAILSLVGFFGQRKIRRAVLANQVSQSVLWTNSVF